MKFFIKILLTLSFAFGITLQEVYDNAESAFGYDKYIVLEPNSIYTGGVGLYEGDVYINCQGSIIDLEEGNGVWVYADEEYPASLDIEYCTITNGLYYGISFGGNSHGNVKNCNLVSTNFGLKLFDYTNVTISNSIFAYNQTYGIGMYTEHPTLETSYSLFWENEESDCMENCPGWGNIWTQLELTPGTGIIYEDPQFIDQENFNFHFLETSPCINNGNPSDTDLDGSNSDIGANTYNLDYCLVTGDLNDDGIVNVLDVVSLSNCILYAECSECSDLNDDGSYNVLDIVDLVYIILN